MSTPWKKTFVAVEPAGGGGTITLSFSELGYHPDRLFTKHVFQMVGGGGGTWTMEQLGPGDVYSPTPVFAAVAAAEIRIIAADAGAANVVMSPCLRVTFNATDGTAKFYVTSYAEYE